MYRILRLSLATLLAGLLFTGCETTQVGQTVAPNNRICVEFDTPHAGWIVGIQEVRVDGMNRLHVYAEVKSRGGADTAFAQVITQVGDCVRVPRYGREVIVYVAGITWNWVPEGVTQIKGVQEYRAQIEDLKAKQVFPL